MSHPTLALQLYSIRDAIGDEFRRSLGQGRQTRL